MFRTTVSPRGLGPSYEVSYYIKWYKTSLTDSMYLYTFISDVWSCILGLKPQRYFHRQQKAEAYTGARGERVKPPSLSSSREGVVIPLSGDDHVPIGILQILDTFIFSFS